MGDSPTPLPARFSVDLQLPAAVAHGVEGPARQMLAGGIVEPEEGLATERFAAAFRECDVPQAVAPPQARVGHDPPRDVEIDHVDPWRRADRS